MFNAWTLARNHHCILRQGCTNYVDGNIFFPNKDSMLFSETQLSTGILTLPLHFINPNPIFANNVFTIVSFFLSGWFMYLLAKRLSKKNELFSIVSGLIFAFAPFKLVAVDHLQNQSIFYFPLIILLIIRYKDFGKKRILAGLFVALVLLFYASWYQMVFALIGIGSFLLGSLIFKYFEVKKILLLGLVVILATVSTLPLAIKYVEFSKSSGAKFSVPEQALYASRVTDYFIPQSETYLGQFVREFKPIARNSYNPDSVSYHSITLYLLSAIILFIAYIKRKNKKLKERNKLVAILFLVGFVGLILSLGPLLQFSQNPYTYVDNVHGTKVVFALPYVLFSILLPQLAFIRAVGRISVLFLFALSALLALLPVYVETFKIAYKYKTLMYVLLFGLLFFELFPTKQIGMSSNIHSYNLKIPAVYTYIKDQKDVNNIIILASDYAYPGVKKSKDNNFRTSVYEQVLWAGYHNKNIYNGYSGYFPKNYAKDYDDFLDFKPDDVAKLKAKKLRYILVDKFLSTSDTSLNDKISKILPMKAYEDTRYALYRIEN